MSLEGDHGHLYPSSFANLFDKYIGCGIMVLGGSTDRQCLCCILEDIYCDSQAFLSLRKRCSTVLRQHVRDDDTSLDASCFGVVVKRVKSQERSRTPIVATRPDEPLLNNIRIGAPLTLPSSSDEDDELSRW